MSLPLHFDSDESIETGGFPGVVECAVECAVMYADASEADARESQREVRHAQQLEPRVACRTQQVQPSGQFLHTWWAVNKGAVSCQEQPTALAVSKGAGS